MTLDEAKKAAEDAGLAKELSNVLDLGFRDAASSVLVEAGVCQAEALRIAHALVDAQSPVPRTYEACRSPLLPKA